MVESDAPPKSSYIMGIGATVAICTVILMVGKLYGDSLNSIGNDVNAIRDQMAIDDARELADAEKFGAIEARLNALEAKR